MSNDPVVAETPRDEPFFQVPSRTWLASQVTILGGILVNAIATGWTVTESKAIALWAVAAIVAYLVPDKKT